MARRYAHYWHTISNSIKRLKKLSSDLKKENTGFTKKENLKMGIQRDKLERSLGGIADMKKIPNMIFIIDTNVEDLAVKEALKLNIPIVAIVDTNSNPTGINYPIPGNDDARRSINLYCELIKKTILDAQKNISTKDSDETKPIITTETSEYKQKMEKVKKLRENTVVGFKDCKNAIDENNGDIEKSIEFLRKKGIAKATKRMGRTAAEGLVCIYESNNKFSMVEINSETDFVAKNSEFINFAEEVSHMALDTSGKT